MGPQIETADSALALADICVRLEKEMEVIFSNITDRTVPFAIISAPFSIFTFAALYSIICSILFT